MSMQPEMMCNLCEDGIATVACPGCGNFICGGCQVNEHLPLGMHEAEDHLDAHYTEEEDDD